MEPNLQQRIARCKERLVEHYGSRLKALILYGSMARHTEDSESDIDLLAVLEPPFDYFSELETLIDLIDDFQVVSARYISLRPASAAEYEAERLPLYRNARREGLAV